MESSENIEHWPPFNGDPVVIRQMRQLCEVFRVDGIIETGTRYGDTTKCMAEFDPNRKLHSIEIDEKPFDIALAHLAACKNVELHLGSSDMILQQQLGRWLVRDKTERPLFYLDAHWHEHWPLHQELAAIASHAFDAAIIVIDDFQVPNRNCTFDKYHDQPNNWDFVKDSIAKCYSRDNFVFYFNNAVVGKLFVFPRHFLKIFDVSENRLYEQEATGFRYSVI